MIQSPLEIACSGSYDSCMLEKLGKCRDKERKSYELSFARPWHVVSSVVRASAFVQREIWDLDQGSASEDSLAAIISEEEDGSW